MKKDTFIFLIPSLALAGAYIGTMIFRKQTEDPQPSIEPASNWPLVKILAVSGIFLFVLNQGKELVK